MEWGSDCFRIYVEFFFAHYTCLSDLAHHGALVADSFHDVASTSLTLSTDHCSTLRDAAESLSEVACATHKRHFEGVLIDVVLIVRGGENFRFVDIINADGL